MKKNLLIGLLSLIIIAFIIFIGIDLRRNIPSMSSGSENSSTTKIAAQPSIASIDSQEKCSTASKAYFENKQQSGYFQTASYSNHFSLNKGQCFMLVHGSDEMGTYTFLINPYENNNVASYQTNYSDAKETCIFGDNPATVSKCTLAEFNNFINQYMQN